MVENQPPASYADFDDEKSPGWLRTLVQFFAIPLLIVCVAVGLYLGIKMMLGAGPQTAQDFVELLQADTINRRWQAAYELAARLGGEEVPAEFRDPRLVSALCQALDGARAEKDDPPKLAMLILRILRRLEDPRALPTVRAAMEDEHPWIRSHAILVAAGLRDGEAIPRIEEFLGDDDPGTRQACLDALAAFDQVEGHPFRLSLRTKELALGGLGDPSADVRFTSALILAHARQREALPVLRKMLDRKHLDSFEFHDQLGALDAFKVRSRTLRRAIQATLWLECSGDKEALDALRRLTQDDVEGDFEVREAARKALATLVKNAE